MSGIAGIIRFDGGRNDPALIAKMTAAMRRRGPDGADHWQRGSVALGHCMLRTTPESLEEMQPLANEDESFVLVFDGRIDNLSELRTNLLAKGARLRTRADAELVLRAYEIWGRDCPHHLLGDFAFAIWDARQHELFCARDHFGVKPFHYFKCPEFLAFSSDEEGFFGIPQIPCEANEGFIASILVPEFDGADFDDSSLKSIVKLPPGMTMVVRPSGQVNLSTYWRLEPREESYFSSDRECQEAFRSVFTEAVRRRMRTLGSPTLMLSGGIDSASIAGAARSIAGEFPGQELQTFSAISDDPASCDETRNIQAIIRGYEHNAHNLSVESVLNGAIDDDLRKAAWTYAHPVSATLLLPAMMYRAASRAGCRVMFDGVDGDLATHVPMLYFADMLRAGQWRNAWFECQQACVNNTYLRQSSASVLFARSLWIAAAPAPLRKLKIDLIRTIRPENPLAGSLINPDFAKRIDLVERLGAWQSRCGSSLRINHQEQQIRSLMPVGIPRGTEGFNRVASRYGIEPRHPWLDKDLLEFYVRLPLKYKARKGWTKYLVRDATAPWLPDNVRWHTGKNHLGWSFSLRVMELSKGLIREKLRHNFTEVTEKYVDKGCLNGVITLFESSRVQDNSGVPDYDAIQKILELLTIADWLVRLRANRSS